MRLEKAIVPLSKSCYDINETVANTAINALKKFPKTEQIQKVIKNAELYWQMRAAKKKGRHTFFKKLKKSDIQLFDKYDRMQQLEKVRQQLSRN